MDDLYLHRVASLVPKGEEFKPRKKRVSKYDNSKRLIITVDGFQVAKINRFGVIPKHKINQFKKAFGDRYKIGYGGIGCILRVPTEGLPEWTPRV